MIRYYKEEHSEGNLAVCNCRITLFGITVYKGRIESTNRQAVAQLAQEKRNKKHVCGFRI